VWQDILQLAKGGLGTRRGRPGGSVSVLDGSLFLRYPNHHSLGEWTPLVVEAITLLCKREMKPGQTTLNELENAILEALAVDHPNLKGMICQLHVLSREFTGVGSYTNFSSAKSSAELDEKQIGLQGSIRIPSVPNGLGAVLFCEKGKPKFLELFTYGDDKWDGEFDGFTVDPNAEQ
jgi:hypothetical protein